MFWDKWTGGQGLRCVLPFKITVISSNHLIFSFDSAIIKDIIEEKEERSWKR